MRRGCHKNAGADRLRRLYDSQRSAGQSMDFSQILHYFETGEHQEKPSFEEVRRMILRHARMMIEFKGEYTGIHEMRKHTAWYTAGYPHSSRLRAAVNTVESLEQLEELLYK